MLSATNAGNTGTNRPHQTESLPPVGVLLRGGSLLQWATRYGERVRVVTGVSHIEVPRILNAMDILAAPSQNHVKVARAVRTNVDRSV
jgi:hypothetical protein